MYIAPIVLIIGYIGETRIRFFELSKGQYRGKTFMNDEEKSYIAGFLDGDGSLMLQLKTRQDIPTKRRFVCTICFYQDSRHDEVLLWIQSVFGIGYISRRNDGMTELRINGFRQVENILSDLMPFIRLKSPQTQAMLAAIKILSGTKNSKLSDEQIINLIDYIVQIQSYNYATRKKKSREELLLICGIDPVST